MKLENLNNLVLWKIILQRYRILFKKIEYTIKRVKNNLIHSNSWSITSINQVQEKSPLDCYGTFSVSFRHYYIGRTSSPSSLNWFWVSLFFNTILKSWGSSYQRIISPVVGWTNQTSWRVRLVLVIFFKTIVYKLFVFGKRSSFQNQIHHNAHH
jgi:hypothetical protein